MAGQELDYGDGVDWRGTADGLDVTMRFSVQFGLAPQEVPFDVPAEQSALPTAAALMNAWNANWPCEASMPSVTQPIVQFARQGQEVKLMRVKAGNGSWQDLPATVNGYVVTNV